MPPAGREFGDARHSREGDDAAVFGADAELALSYLKLSHYRSPQGQVWIWRAVLMPSSPGGSRSCNLDSSPFSGIMRQHDRDGNSRRRRSGPRRDGWSARGTVGVGGGFLVIPLLGFFYGMDQQTAQGTVLIMVVPNVVWAFSRYRRRFGIDMRLAATIAGSALIAAYPTAHFATGLDPHVLRLAFALFLAAIAATVAYYTWHGGSRVEAGPTRAWGWIALVGVIGGCFSGIFGVGGAFVAPPLLTTFFGFRQLEAQGLALALVSPSAFIALLAYAEADRVDWLIGLPLAIGGIAAISAGVKFASRLPERRMRLASVDFCCLPRCCWRCEGDPSRGSDCLSMGRALLPRSPARRPNQSVRETKVSEATDEFSRVYQRRPRRSCPI